MRRRSLLRGVGALIASAGVPPLAGAQTRPAERPVATDVTERLARYMVEARDRSLPPDVMTATRHRILDTLGAIVSGARLKPGEAAIRYVCAQGGAAETSVCTTDIKTTAEYLHSDPSTERAAISRLGAHRRGTARDTAVTQVRPSPRRNV